ncbi:MAG: hypothetical protein WCV84_00975 [Patescibacteria group bacterium]
MLLATTQDTFYLVASICLALITIFLVWGLYELARLVHQTNDMVDDTRNKIERLETALITIGERFASVSQYVGLIAAGAKEVIGMVRQDKGKKKRSASRDEDEE